MSPSDFSILQYKNPNKDMLEKLLFEKKITILTNIDIYSITFNNKSIILITPKLYKIMNKTQHEAFLKKLKSYFEYYYLPMNIKSHISINYEKKNTRSILIYQDKFRFAITQFLGTRDIYIFPPNSRNNLYYDKKKDQFNIDFWDQNTTLYPNIINAKYIHVKLSPQQTIFIPYRWTYCYEITENSMSVSFYSESIFSNFLKNNK